MTIYQGNRPRRAPFLNAPSVVLWLIAVLVALHALRVLMPGDIGEWAIDEFSLVPARYAALEGAAGGAGGWLRLALPFVTYMFLHGDFTHVGINSLWLLVFGPIVAQRLGNRQFLLFFFSCGIAAAALHLVVYWGIATAMVGASGGVSGLMGAGIRMLYARFAKVPEGLAPIFSKPILMFSLVWAIVNIVSGVLRIGVSDDVTLIAWVAHLGGYFAGLVAIGTFGGALPAEPENRMA